MARISQVAITGTSPAAASTVAGATQEGLGEAVSLTIVATLAGATGGTLDVYLQTSYDDGTTWYDMAHFPQLAGGAASSVRVWHVTRQEPLSTLTTIGSALVPALAANTVLNHWGNKIRSVYVAGGGTSAGAAVNIKLAAFYA